MKAPIREQKDPVVLLKTEYKALLQVAGQNRRDFAIVMLFLQTGLRVSELVNLRLGDVSLETKELTVRQGKGRKDRVVPLVGQALEALKAYLKVRTPSLEYSMIKFFTLDVSLTGGVAVSSGPALDSALAPSFLGRPSGQLPYLLL